MDDPKIKRILVVDDQATARRMISGIMAQYGHVDTAENGQDALAQHAGAIEDGWGYDLISMDITMPGLLSGYQVVRCIRIHEEKLGLSERVPIIMVSSLGNMKELEEEQGLYGANDYIAKPFDRARMNEVIQRFLYRSSMP